MAEKRLKTHPATIQERIRYHAQDIANMSQVVSQADLVVSVDSAYHFQTRRSFLHSATQVLTPGGRLAVVDIVITQPTSHMSLLDRIKLFAMAKLAGWPWENIWTLQEYQDCLSQLEYKHIDACVVDENAFDSLSKHIRQVLADYKDVLHPLLQFKYGLVASLFEWTTRQQWVKLVFITAET